MRRMVKYGSVLAVGMALTVGLAGCSIFSSKADDKGPVVLSQKGSTLWESNLQYVKIVDRDTAGAANGHPASISVEDMRTVLGSLYVSERVLLTEKQNPLFSYGELQVLSTALASGLAQVKPDEDINFVTIGLHSGGLTKERQTNSGRVFMSDGHLNIIFGLMHEEYRDKDRLTGQQIDRRVNPLLPGTRKSEASLAAKIALDKGQSYHLDPDTGKERTDWLVIDIPTVLQTAKERAGKDDGSISPELKEQIAHNKQETGNLRGDVSTMKGVLFDMSEQLEQLKKEIEALKRK